jgi:23S rRNA (cytidine2498-2'-O)-methyltransferase
MNFRPHSAHRGARQGPPPLPDAVTEILLYCRPGFEGECAAEMQALATRYGVSGYLKAKADAGYVNFVAHEPALLGELWREARFDSLVFARQWIFCLPRIDGLPVGDRVKPLAEAATLLDGPFDACWLETADTNEAKTLSAFCRKFEKPFLNALQLAGRMRAQAPLRLHVFFLGSAAAQLGISRIDNSAPWLMGFQRLRLPRAAPSRSTLKLVEAIMTFDLEPELQAGQTAVDLGASPGGWTFQLVQRELHVTAVDNGNMDAALMNGGNVDHERADGFRYRPKRPVSWVVCDMVEQPIRIARLIADWIADGHAQSAVFNLKLPMKKRREELQRCYELIADRLDDAGVHYSLRFKQLYHDREEVTGCLRRLAPSKRQKSNA